MFLFKKLVAPMFFPLSLCLEILILGVIFLWFTRRQKTGKVLVTIGIILLGGLSLRASSDRLLRPLEYKYPSLVEFNDISDVKWIVVLGSGHTSDPEITVTDQISYDSLVRLIEGIRIQKILSGSKLILSGGSVPDPVPNAQIMADVALAVGVDENILVLESTSRDTKDQARLIKKMVGDDRFVLVTSASHMPRSMALFKKQGMEPIPAPTDHLVKERQGARLGIPFPSANGLRKAERAFYEYLGLAWAKFRGQI